MNVYFDGYEHEGTTLIPFDQLKGLMLPITQLGQLNEVEANNLRSAARDWLILSKRPTFDKFLTVDYAMQLHGYCFGTVWDWAGKSRNVQTNIGVPVMRISIDLRQLMDNIRYRIHLFDNQSNDGDEPVLSRNLEITNRAVWAENLAIEFAYKLIWIHPFNNGNGRWSRFYTDQFCDLLKISRFSWGKSIPTIPARRNEMITSLRIADQSGDLSAFLSWAKK